ncbi:MAG: hypothetical protein OHK0036_11770 [Bacteroidia bacterium]
MRIISFLYNTQISLNQLFKFVFLSLLLFRCSSKTFEVTLSREKFCELCNSKKCLYYDVVCPNVEESIKNIIFIECQNYYYINNPQLNIDTGKYILKILDFEINLTDDKRSTLFVESDKITCDSNIIYELVYTNNKISTLKKIAKLDSINNIKCRISRELKTNENNK